MLIVYNFDPTKRLSHCGTLFPESLGLIPGSPVHPKMNDHSIENLECSICLRNSNT